LNRLSSLVISSSSSSNSARVGKKLNKISLNIQ